ncbi:unnamed protein product [Allacma fusca]|uniref:Chitin-binding type-2 domain-containing protein n=1 Tax=Allacma fusca TaxID=39272 RepID=A0A8J2JR77_9HEXA|nr:unnamed protein product [Allacma fusca]
MNKSMKFMIALLSVLTFEVCRGVQLQSYNVDPDLITISGFSSGGAMAMQFHVAYSQVIAGAGILAGLPYSCGKNDSSDECLDSPEGVNIGEILMEIDDQASKGKINPTSHINGTQVFIWHGSNDTMVYPTSSLQILEIYDYYGANIKTKLDIPSGHGFPTNFYGTPCGSSSTAMHYINNCNYHGAYETLKNLLGEDLIDPSSNRPMSLVAGQLLEYEQTEFVKGLDPSTASMDPIGYIYVPTTCENKILECKLHIAFHGCTQNRANLGEIYVTKTGYLEVAELNNIIVLFPQAAANARIGNPNSCWDWWGYTNDNFLNQDGAQMDAIYQMIRRIAEEEPEKNKMRPVIVLLLALAAIGSNAVKLQSYNVDPDSITISGLSSGGAFVMQFHLAYSQEIIGAGILAGLPYSCGKGGLTSATLCMTLPSNVISANVIKEIDSQASKGSINATSYISGSKIFIVHGTKDTTVNPTASTKIKEVYDHYGAVIKTKLDIASVHGYPTDFYGAACGSSSASTHYINNCNYHGAYETLKHLLGDDLVAPSGSGSLAGQLIEYEQGEFLSGLPSTSSMDAHGYVYIPSGCADKSRQCRLHISFHGCQQSKGNLGDIYATKTGYLEVAEKNNIIVLFPQAAANMLIGNPNACWDWWGYLNANYLNQNGAQMSAVHKMMRRIVDCDDCSVDPPVTTTTVKTTTPGDNTPAPGTCRDNEISFQPFPGKCDTYILCACGAEVLQHCAPGLYFDPKINSCNFIQLVDCTPSH